MKNLFYFHTINSIGGIEQFFAYLSEKYKDWDITIVYRKGDPKQIARLRRYVRVEKFTGRVIECDKAFFCYNSDIRHAVQAKESVLMLHGDYKAMIEQGQLSENCYLLNCDFDEYYGVSQQVCDTWKELTGKECKLVYNPFIARDKKRILRLVYCGRLTPEKGGDLLEKLIKRLDARSVDYQLFIYSNKDLFTGPNIFYLNTRLDAEQFLNPDNYDFLIVPSKNEGYCYSLVQALSNGLPVVATPCPVFKEIGLNNDNSITLEFDGSNIDAVIDNMLCSHFDFHYVPKEDTWSDCLVPGKSDYEEHYVPVKAIKKYFDLEMQEHIGRGEEFLTSESRSKILSEAGCVEIMED